MYFNQNPKSEYPSMNIGEIKELNNLVPKNKKSCVIIISNKVDEFTITDSDIIKVNKK